MEKDKKSGKFIQQVSPEVIEQIIKLCKDGVPNGKIGKKFKITARTVRYWLNKNGIEFNRFRAPIDMVSETEAKCKKCKEIKSIDEFKLARKGKENEYRFAFCYKCLGKQVKERINADINKFLSSKYSGLVNRCGGNGVVLTISREYYINQYHKQNGKCFYTDIEMTWGVGNVLSKYAASFDKIIPELGYIPGNVVFCINKINTCKNDLNLLELRNWMPIIYKKIINYFKKENNNIIYDTITSSVIRKDLNLPTIKISA